MLSFKESRPEFIQSLSDVYVTNLNEKVTLECITKTPRSVNPYKVKWFKDGVEITKNNSPHFTMFNYCNDEHIDGSVLNFNKLVIEAPLSLDDEGEYTVYINEDLKSSARLIIEQFRSNSQQQQLMHQQMQQQQQESVEFNKIYVKKSKLEGFQNLVPSEKDMIYTEMVTYQIDMPEKQQSQLTTIIEKDDKKPIESSTKLIKIVKQDDDLEFTKQLEPFTDCDEGRDVVLECCTNKYDTYAEWFKDNKLLTSSPQGKYEVS